MPEWFNKLYTDSGMEYDIEEEDAINISKEYDDLLIGRFGQFKENLLSELLADNNVYAACYPNVVGYIEGKSFSHNDEAEITLFSPEKFFKNISMIFVDGEEFETTKEAINYINENYEVDELEWQEKYRD